MAETKMTKKMWYEEIRKIIENTDVENQNEMLEFIDAQMTLLDERAKKAAERAAQRKIEGDALRDKIESLLTDEYQGIAEITAQANDEEVTKAKVTARLSQLVKAEKAVKDIIKTEDGKKITAYKLA